MVIVQLWLSVFLCYGEEAFEDLGLYAKGACLMDLESGRILYEKNGQEFMPMASTTKIMTCILALEYGEMDQVVTVSEKAAAMPDVQLNICTGEKYYLKDLLYSLMLESHNDSAVAAAEAVGGSLEGFLLLMNEKAEEIGCTKTNFVTPNGLDGTNQRGDHGTTPRDLCEILRYCIGKSPKAQDFLEITRTMSYSFSDLSGSRNFTCSNHNALLSMFTGAVTGKTGFTSKAGYCYVGAVTCNDMTFLISLLGSGNYPHKSYKWQDVRKLLEYGASYYKRVKIERADGEILPVQVKDGMKETVRLKAETEPFYYPVKDGEKLTVKTEVLESVKAPVKTKMEVGKIKYYLGDTCIREIPILTDEKVEAADFGKYIIKKIRKLVKILRICS